MGRDPGISGFFPFTSRPKQDCESTRTFPIHDRKRRCGPSSVTDPNVAVERRHVACSTPPPEQRGCVSGPSPGRTLCHVIQWKGMRCGGGGWVWCHACARSCVGAGAARGSKTLALMALNVAGVVARGFLVGRSRSLDPLPPAGLSSKALAAGIVIVMKQLFHQYRFRFPVFLLVLHQLATTGPPPDLAAPHFSVYRDCKMCERNDTEHGATLQTLLMLIRGSPRKTAVDSVPPITD